MDWLVINCYGCLISMKLLLCIFAALNTHLCWHSWNMQWVFQWLDTLLMNITSPGKSVSDCDFSSVFWNEISGHFINILVFPFMCISSNYCVPFRLRAFDVTGCGCAFSIRIRNYFLTEWLANSGQLTGWALFTDWLCDAVLNWYYQEELSPYWVNIFCVSRSIHSYIHASTSKT